MTAQAADLLKALGSRAVPGLAPVSSLASAAAQTRLGGLDFARMLEQARGGSLASGRQVTLGKGAGVELTDDQIKRISVAADIAEAQGATRALVMIDGMAIKLDVSMREVTGAVDMKKAGVLTGIDAVIDVPSTDSADGAGKAVAPTGHFLLKSLASRGAPRAA